MPQDVANNFNLDKVVVRLAGDEDHSTVRELFKAGLLEGHVPANDTGADVENLREAYFSDEGQSALWVAQYKDQIIGMVGVQKMCDNSAEIRRLRVREGFRRCGVGTKLTEQALGFCQRHGYLKVILDVRIERGPAIALFEKFGFQLARSREVEGRKMLDFYIDLYRDPNA
ncbi:MAG: GNAT family N-acetyltransferase [Planctomycetes bacterium]|nr:GNAT family N-acetyltransferase [Planctomycetota bacterium]